jgi:hypothetical protein
MRAGAVDSFRRTWMVGRAHHGQRVPAIAQERQLTPTTVRRWLQHRHGQGLTSLAAQPQAARQALSPLAPVSAVAATRLTPPETWGSRGLSGRSIGCTPLGLRARGFRARALFGQRVVLAFVAHRGASRRSTRRRPQGVSAWGRMRGERSAPRGVRDRHGCRARPPRDWPSWCR